MDRKKILAVVRGYLLKEKRNTVRTDLFLCFVTVFLLIGNQLFANVQTANRLNAEAGVSFHLGQTEDGTAFEYVDECYRALGADMAEANIKQVIEGRWAQKENEVVFTKNYLERYGLKQGKCAD